MEEISVKIEAAMVRVCEAAEALRAAKACLAVAYDAAAEHQTAGT